MSGLTKLQKETGLDYAVINAGKLAYQDIIDKLTAGNDMVATDSEATTAPVESAIISPQERKE